MALEQVSSVVKSTYYNSVAGYNINYNITRQEDELVTAITGYVTKADIRVGYISANVDGARSINLEKAVPDEASKEIYSAVLDDTAAIFRQRNNLEQS